MNKESNIWFKIYLEKLAAMTVLCRIDSHDSAVENYKYGVLWEPLKLIQHEITKLKIKKLWIRKYLLCGFQCYKDGYIPFTQTQEYKKVLSLCADWEKHQNLLVNTYLIIYQNNHFKKRWHFLGFTLWPVVTLKVNWRLFLIYFLTIRIYLCFLLHIPQMYKKESRSRKLPDVLSRVHGWCLVTDASTSWKDRTVSSKLASHQSKSPIIASQ
jgi:hypothetical protein